MTETEFLAESVRSPKLAAKVLLLRKALRESIRLLTQRADRAAALNVQLQQAIRHVRDQRGDDRCWKDYESLFAMLPEGYTPPARDETVELELCRQFIRSCHDQKVEYVSPQRRIEELERQIAEMRDRLPPDYRHS